MQEPTARAQFAHDFIMVTDNNGEAYREAIDTARNEGGNVAKVSDKFREQFEAYISDVVEREHEQGNHFGADLIGELLLGFGSSPFDIIAKHYIDTDLEQRLYENFSQSLANAGE